MLYLLLIALICGRAVGLDPNDDALTTKNGAWVSVSIIIGLSGGLLLLLFLLLKVGQFSTFLSQWFDGTTLVHDTKKRKHVECDACKHAMVRTARCMNVAAQKVATTCCCEGSSQYPSGTRGLD